MRHLFISIAAVALVASACGKGKDDPAKSAAKQAEAPATHEQAEAPKPYEGPLTAERMQQAQDATKPFQKWDEAYARILAIVGTPTAIDGNKHYWYLMVEDMCHELSVENNNGEVGAFGLGKYSNVMKAQFEKCQPVAGEDEAAAAGDEDEAAGEAEAAAAGDEDEAAEAAGEDEGDE